MNMNEVYDVGCEVLTQPYGWGYVSTTPIDASSPLSSIVVKLDWGLLTTTVSAIQRKSFCSIGSNVLTKYGNGILIDYDRANDMHVIRLWNVLANDGGSAVAFMMKGDIIRVIKAAVGCRVKSLTYGTGCVLQCHENGDTFTIKIDNNDNNNNNDNNDNYNNNNNGNNMVRVNCDDIACVDSKYIPSAYYLIKLVIQQLASFPEPVKLIISSLLNGWGDGGGANIADHLLKNELIGEYSSSLIAGHEGHIIQLLCEVNSLLENRMKTYGEGEGSSDKKKKLSSILTQTTAIITNLQSESCNRIKEFQRITDFLITGGGINDIKELLVHEPVICTVLDKLKETHALWMKISQEVSNVSSVVTSKLQSSKLLAGSDGRGSGLSVLLKKIVPKGNAGSNDTMGILMRLVNTITSPGESEASIEKIFDDILTGKGEDGGYASKLTSLTELAILLAISFSQSSSKGSSRGEGKGCFGAKVAEAFIVDLLAKSNTTMASFEIRQKFIDVYQDISTKGKGLISDPPVLNALQENIGRILASDAVTSGNVTKQLMSASTSVVSTIETIRNAEFLQQAVEKFSSVDLGSVIASTVKDIDVDNVISLADNVLNDTEARANLISKVTDQVLDFLLEYIPALSIPDIDGATEEMEYSVGGLDLSGFKVKKEGVTVDIATNFEKLSTSNLISFDAVGINAKFKNLEWGYNQLSFPFMRGDGFADADVQNASISIAFRLVRIPQGTTSRIMESQKAAADPTMALLAAYPQLAEHIVNARLSLRDRLGTAVSVNGSGSGSIWLSSEAGGGTITEWEPALVISACSVSIDSLNLSIENNGLSWLYNLITSMFSGVIKDYVQESINEVMRSSSGLLLSTINSAMGEYWPLIQQYLGGGVQMSALQEASAYDMLKLLGQDGGGSQGYASTVQRSYTLKFDEASSEPLGLRLDFRKNVDGQMGPSIQAKVVVLGVIDKSQAQRVLGKAKLDERFISDAIMKKVNGKNIVTMGINDILAILKGDRPLVISIRLSDNGYQALKAYHAKQKADELAEIEKHVTSPLQAVRVTFNEGPLGIRLKDTGSCGGACIITGFVKGDGGEVLQAERSGKLSTGMILLGINNEIVFGRPLEEVTSILKSAKRPLQTAFVRTPDSHIILNQYPSELKLSSRNGQTIISRVSSDVPLLAKGLVILQINKTPVTSSHRPGDVTAAIKACLPAKLTVRNMNTFLHLIKIRDGAETIEHIVCS